MRSQDCRPMSNTEQKSLVPKIRFPEFQGSGDWVIKPFKKAAKVIDPHPSHRAPQAVTEGVPFIGIGDISEQGVVDFSNVRIVAGEVYDEHKRRYVLSRGDFAFGRVASVGKVVDLSNNVDSRYTYSPTMAIIKPSNVNATYLKYFVQSEYFMNQVASKTTGSTRKSLGVQNLRILNICLPEEKRNEEQQKIADCLSSLDELISAHSEKLNSLKAYKKGLMQQLFPVEGQTVPKLRFPEFRNSGEWEKLSIQQLIDKDYLFPPKDGNHGNIHPKSSDFVSSGIPFVMASDIQNGKINFAGCSKIRKKQADNLQKGFSKQGDVLLTHKGTVGEIALVPENDNPYLMLTPQVTYYRVQNTEKLINHYLAYAFLSNQFQEALKIVSGGGTRAYIGITEQRKLQLIIPKTIEEQQKIADCLSSLDELISAQDEKIETLKQHKKGLMQQLFPAMD